MNYGDAAVVYKCSFSDLKVGDIIIFNDPQGNPQVIVHRIVEVKNPQSRAEYLVTKGDNNNTNPLPDPWNVTSTYYLSKVLVIVPYAGYFSPAFCGLSGPVEFLPIALFVSVACSASYFWKVPRKPKSGG